MLRLIAIAGFALSISTSAQAITPAPLPQVDEMVTQVAVGCGPGRTRIRRRMRCTDYRPPDPPRRPSVCAMAGRYLCFVRVNATLWRSIQQGIGRQLSVSMHNAILRLFIASTLTILKLPTFSRDVGHRILRRACNISRFQFRRRRALKVPGQVAKAATWPGVSMKCVSTGRGNLCRPRL